MASNFEASHCHTNTQKEESVLKIKCVVKGYQECKFSFEVGEEFCVFKKYGDRGRAFRVTNGRGQLGHIQKELVAPLWKFKDGFKW